MNHPNPLEMWLPVKLAQIISSDNVAAKHAVTVMIEAAHRKRLRDPASLRRVMGFPADIGQKGTAQ